MSIKSIKTRLDKLLEARSGSKATTTPTIKLRPLLSPEAWAFLFQPGFDRELTAKQMVEVDKHRNWMEQRHAH